MKKLTLFLSVLCLSSQIFCEAKSESELRREGRGFASGLFDEFGNRLQGPEFEKGVEHFTQKLIDNVFEGARKSFQQGGQFDGFMKDFGGASRRAMNSAATDFGDGMKDGSKIIRKDMIDATSEVSKGMNESVSVWGKEVKETFKEGSEFDKGTKTFFDTNAKNINSFINQVGHKNLIKGGAITLGIAGGYFALKYGIPLAYKMIERRLTRPKLIIESSKKSLVQRFKSLFTSVKQSLEMVFSPALKEQLDNIVKVTQVINSKIKQGFTNIKYRNLMLYGPPGTGKTMFAKELAKRCGLEYVFMSGSSFSKFKDGEGIEALDELFAWAKRSKGLLIFIDEAETFLSKRENMDPQSKAYQLLNNFLNYTGDRSSQFMIVFATNHKDALDSAMYRRIDDLIEMPLPSKEQRVGTLKLYINKILMDVKQNGKVFVDSVVQYFDGQMIDDIAQKTKGLSYGDLEGIINTIKTDSDILDPSVVSVALINTVVERAVKKHQAFTQGQPLGFVED